MTDDEPDYDECLHITAGELRGMGIEIPSDIPDCAWTSRDDVEFDHDSVSITHTDEGSRRLSLIVDVTTGTFHWYALDDTITLH